MIITIYFILRNLLNSINEKGKEYFTIRLSELDKKQKDENGNIINNEESVKQTLNSTGEVSNSNDSIFLYQSKNVDDFDVKDVLNFIKKVDSKFNFDDRYIVEEFVKQTDMDNSNNYYSSLKTIKNHIKRIGKYNLVTNLNDEISKFKKYIMNENSELLSSYEKLNGDFDVENFISYLDMEIEKNDPTIYVFVGNKNVSFNDVSKRVKTIFKEDIYRGIQIKYKGNVYDYSIG